jgi:hypothetical protein
MQLITVAGAVAARCGALVTRIVARLAVGQYVVLVARALAVAAGFCADVPVGVLTRRAVRCRHMQRIAVAGAIATRGSAHVAAVAARRAVRQYMVLVAGS